MHGVWWRVWQQMQGLHCPCLLDSLQAMLSLMARINSFVP